MRKGIVVALAVTGSLVVGPAALAASADPSGPLPGYSTPQHADHDHGKKAGPKNKDKPKKKDKPKNKDGKGKDEKKLKHGSVHDHRVDDHFDHQHRGDHGDGAHSGGGYDSHRSHPRPHSAPIGLTTASGDVLDHGQDPAKDDHDHDGDGKPDHDPEDHDKDQKPRPKPAPKPGS